MDGVITLLARRGSRSARQLLHELRRRIPQERVARAYADSRRHTGRDRFVINWGCVQVPFFTQRHLTLSNPHEAVAFAANKLTALRRMQAANVPTPMFTTSADEAFAWNARVFVRHTLAGSGGTGIEVVEAGNPLPAAPLYTREFRKHKEFRVHVAFGEAVCTQQKRRRRGEESTQAQRFVRSNDNGWVFCVNDRDDVRFGYTELLHRVALSAVAAVNARHGAVDILVREGQEGRTVSVCEVNTAPGIASSACLDAWASAFVKEIAAWKTR